MELQSHPLMLDTLARLNEIGAAINDLGSGDLTNVEIEATLRMIVESATEVMPDSSVVLYTYDEAKGAFDPASRVSAEGPMERFDDDVPRPHGISARTVAERRRVLSYEEPDLHIHPAKVAMGAQVMASYPLIVGKELLGALYLYTHEDRHLTALELLILDNLVNQAAKTLSLARQLALVQQEQVRKGKELRRLRRAGMLISSRSSLQATLDTILQMALEDTDAGYGIFRLMDKTGEHLVMRAFVGEGLDQPAIEPLPINRESIIGIVASDRSPLVISDLRQEPWCHVYYPLDPEFEMRSELAVPLIGASDRLEGVLNLESPQGNAFSKQDRYILQILATQAVSAIQEARLLDALQEISEMLFTQSRQNVLERLVEQACDLLNAFVGVIWIIENNQLVLQAATDDHFRGEQLAIQTSLTGQVIRTGCPVASIDICQDPRFTRPDLARQYSWGSALIVPLLASDDDSPVGVFSVYTSQSDLREFAASEWDKKVLTILAHYAALAVQYTARQEALRVAQEQHAIAETFAAVGDIAANLMHRLNNKVGTIPVRVEGIQDKYHSVLDTHHYLAQNLAEIERSASEAIQIVGDSLFHLRPISLSSVRVAICLEHARVSANLPPGVRVQFHGMENIQSVQADQKRLTLVFINLLENAAVAMEEEGIIQIRGTMRDGWIDIAVRDTGPGIPSDLHERIFEFNFSGLSRERPGKLGFGLWWVKTLMVRMGGTIVVERDSQPGTTFVLRFPCD